jgi:hypothetical protein
VDNQSRPRVRPKKSARDRLIRLAQSHPDWVIGFEDETWWSRLARPRAHAWTNPGEPLRLVEQSVDKNDPDPKALACYGLLVRLGQQYGYGHEEVWLRFVQGQPVSDLTIGFLDWSCDKLHGLGKKALLLVWDNARWHTSHKVRVWIGQHNLSVKRDGKGVRIINCLLPIKSPWLNPIEPHWVHGKRQVVEADGLLTTLELTDRVYDYFGFKHEEYLSIPEKVA